MRKLVLIIPVFVILLIAVYIITSPAFGQQYFAIGEGPVRDIETDYIQGQLIVSSGSSIFVISAGDGQVISEYQIPNGRALDIAAGYPQISYIYGAGYGFGETINFSLNRTSSQIDYINLPEEILVHELVQCNDKIFTTGHDQGLYSNMDEDMLCAVVKENMSYVGTWPCIDWPMNAIYDATNDLIIIGEGMSRPHSSGDGDTGPWGEGVSEMSRVTLYDTSGEGQIVDQFTVEGSITGLAQANDGTIIAGLGGDKEWEIKSATFALLSDPIEYIEIESLHVVRMDYDSAADRVICSAFDYVTEEANNVIVWDYNTREYEVIDTGVEVAQVIKFLDGKLYASNGEDNKVYVISIDE